MRVQAFTMHVVSSMTITAPDPRPEPALASDSAVAAGGDGMTYACPPGGLPSQNEHPESTAIFTEAYAVIPASVTVSGARRTRARQ